MLGHGLGSWADLCDNFSFRVFIDNQEFGFSRVMNLEQDQEVEEFQVGGMNFAPHIAVSPNKKGGRLILEKGKCFSSGQKQIKNWRAAWCIWNREKEKKILQWNPGKPRRSKKILTGSEKRRRYREKNWR